MVNLQAAVKELAAEVRGQLDEELAWKLYVYLRTYQKGVEPPVHQNRSIWSGLKEDDLCPTDEASLKWRRRSDKDGSFALFTCPSCDYEYGCHDLGRNRKPSHEFRDAVRHLGIDPWPITDRESCKHEVMEMQGHRVVTGYGYDDYAYTQTVQYSTCVRCGFYAR